MLLLCIASLYDTPFDRECKAHEGMKIRPQNLEDAGFYTLMSSTDLIQALKATVVTLHLGDLSTGNVSLVN